MKKMVKEKLVFRKQVKILIAIFLPIVLITLIWSFVVDSGHFLVLCLCAELALFTNAIIILILYSSFSGSNDNDSGEGQ